MYLLSLPRHDSGSGLSLHDRSTFDDFKDLINESFKNKCHFTNSPN